MHCCDILPFWNPQGQLWGENTLGNLRDLRLSLGYWQNRLKKGKCSTLGYPRVLGRNTSVPKIIDPVFAKTSPKRSFCMTENERFGLVFVKTGSINSGTGIPGVNGSKSPKHMGSGIDSARLGIDTWSPSQFTSTGSVCSFLDTLLFFLSQDLKKISQDTDS